MRSDAVILDVKLPTSSVAVVVFTGGRVVKAAAESPAET